jgi:hypothetical protein
MYQIAIRYWISNIPNGHKIFSIPRPSKKYTQIGIFGLKIFHLATLRFTFESAANPAIVKFKETVQNNVIVSKVFF